MFSSMSYKWPMLLLRVSISGTSFGKSGTGMLMEVLPLRFCVFDP